MPRHDSGPRLNSIADESRNGSGKRRLAGPPGKFKVQADLNHSRRVKRAALSAARAAVRGEVGGWRWGVSDPGARPRSSPGGPRTGSLTPHCL
jgi:hypothetical protein